MMKHCMVMVKKSKTIEDTLLIANAMAEAEMLIVSITYNLQEYLVFGMYINKAQIKLVDTIYERLIKGKKKK